MMNTDVSKPRALSTRDRARVNISGYSAGHAQDHLLHRGSNALFADSEKIGRLLAG